MNCLPLSSPFVSCTTINTRCISYRQNIIFHASGSGFNRRRLEKFGFCASGKYETGEIEFSEGFPKGNQNGSSLKEIDGSNISFGTIDTEKTEEKINFFVSDAEGDPDRPSEGYSSIEEAINALKQGKFVIAVDDENGEQEGNFVMAAALASIKAIAFMIKHGSGIVSVGMKEEDIERLNISLISPFNDVGSLSDAASMVTVDARVSAEDRTRTIVGLSSPESKPEDFRYLCSHVFPLKYKKGGVLNRAGHTEGSVDLVLLAGLRPVSVLSTIVDPYNGSIAKIQFLKKFAKEYDLPIVSITDLIRYRRKREKLVERIAVSRLPTKWGLFQAYCYRSKLDGTEHIAVVKGDIGDGQEVVVRVHSECLTGDILGSSRCDCGNQLDLAMRLIEQERRGVLVYLRGHEGRGIGLGHKLRAYNLQDLGHDTVQANLELGFSADCRDYSFGAQILRDIGVRTMRLMTNNPAKFIGLKGYGLAVVSRIPVIAPITQENQRYLETKRIKMGHVYGSDLPGTLTGFLEPDAEISDLIG